MSESRMNKSIEEENLYGDSPFLEGEITEPFDPKDVDEWNGQILCDSNPFIAAAELLVRPYKGPLRTVYKWRADQAGRPVVIYAKQKELLRYSKINMDQCKEKAAEQSERIENRKAGKSLSRLFCSLCGSIYLVCHAL